MATKTTKAATNGTRRRKTLPLESENQRRELAARHPVVREFDHLIAAARRLSKRMEKWLRANDRPDDNEGMIHFDLATFDELCDRSSLDELLQQLRGMQWALDSGCTILDGYTPDPCFPEMTAAMREKE